MIWNEYGEEEVACLSFRLYGFVYINLIRDTSISICFREVKICSSIANRYAISWRFGVDINTKINRVFLQWRRRYKSTREDHHLPQILCYIDSPEISGSSTKEYIVNRRIKIIGYKLFISIYCMVATIIPILTYLVIGVKLSAIQLSVCAQCIFHCCIVRNYHLKRV